jgi:hypothetical protein
MLSKMDERECSKCGKWIYWDNGDATFHCFCHAGWTWLSKFVAKLPSHLSQTFDSAVGLQTNPVEDVTTTEEARSQQVASR